MTHVEFIGGPFDGHSLYVSDMAEGLATTVALPVNENVFRMLDGEERGPARGLAAPQLSIGCKDTTKDDITISVHAGLPS